MHLRALILICFAALLTGCKHVIPSGTAERMPFPMADSIFVSPVLAGDTGQFSMPEKLWRSSGDEADYIRVWSAFLDEELKRRGSVLVRPQVADSTAHAMFHCPMMDETWREIYGVSPGRGSRILIVDEMELVAINQNWFERFFTALNLTDTSYQEWGYLDLKYRIFDMDSDAGSGQRRLVSREPDTPWVSNRMDRAGRLMMRGARDLSEDLKK
jgi:hypothetical protein